MMKIAEASTACVGFTLLLLSIYAAHMRWVAVDVVFYAALADAALAAVVATALLFALRSRIRLSSFERSLLGVIFFLGGYGFAISVPTVIDRSLSFYLLEKLHQRGGGIEEAAMFSVFVDEYVVEHRLIDVRLTEQIESGTIKIVEGCVLLTDKGRRIAGFSRWFRQNLLPRRRQLLGTYSDALTDPFRFSVARADYACFRETTNAMGAGTSNPD